ncbi:GEVED domain-containing protein [Flavobacterium sp. J27]|uniref:GEVED domain-containing protein n=1 Tax=Flavobacterium sp. J27 TaxID=2060419 RepID=UPI0010300D08|nr:GEVED domain-containing protein [Flavobacterium sp. J27]
MKKSNTLLRLFLVLGILLSCNLKVVAQFNEDAPWMQTLQPISKKEKVTIDEMVASFNQYWLTHDKDKKGSGYKPFMRWEYHWRNNEHPDGTVITPQEINMAWQMKQGQIDKNKNILTQKSSNWQPVGPFNHTINGSWSAGQGRVNVVYVDPNNSSVIYVGTPAGGIWKTTNAGTTWSPLSDELPQIGVSGIVTDYSNSNIIYIATGDKDAGDTYSIGVLKSTNGGLTWNTTGLSFSNTSTRAGDIYMHPTNSNILWVATSVGVYKTTNAGVSWTNVLSGNIKDIKLKPGDPTTIYAVTTSAFYKSTDGGNSFAQITSGLPTTSGRLAIGVTPANGNYVYLLSANTSSNSYSFQGVYRSTNSGVSFTKMASTTDVFESSQAWYDFAFEVSPNNENLIFTGVLNIWKSTNGGASFSKVNNWSSPTAATYTHADIHFLRYYGNKLYCGSDGGIYESSDNAASFTSKTTGLQISQFYKIAVSKQTSANMVGGLQDNGGYGYSGNQWKNYYGADGMDTGVDPNNSNKYYGFIQSGGGLYISTNGGNSLSTTVNKPSGETGNWVTPLAINGTGEVFAGYKKVYRLNGSSWVAGTTAFSTAIENVIVDPSNDNIMYVSDASKLYKSTDKGINFSLVYTFPTTVKNICVHTTNSAIVYAITQGTSGLVYQSTNGGTSFSSISTGLPSIGKNVIVHQGQDPNNTLYVGTTLGVYHKDDTMSSWLPFDTNLPNVSVTDLEINYVDNNLTAATYGRGIWRTALSTSSDATPPTTPTNLTASGTTQSSTNLSWTASSDNIGVTGYDIYRGSNLMGSTTSTSYSVTGLSAATTYSFSVKAKDAAGNVSSSSNIVTITTLNNTVTYCSSASQNATEEYIGRVVIGSINNASSGTSGYENFTAISTNLGRGTVYTITITPVWPGPTYSEGYAVWIDYNNDGDFVDSGELVWSKTASTTTPVSGSFTVPTSATLGNTRMRITLKYNGIPTSCETYSYGQTEDYTVNITGSSPEIATTIVLTNDAESNGNAILLKIYPNPVEDYLYLDIKDFKANDYSYEIIDYHGKVVKRDKLNATGIDVSALTNGVFFLKLIKEDVIIFEEFIKK